MIEFISTNVVGLLFALLLPFIVSELVSWAMMFRPPRGTYWIGVVLGWLILFPLVIGVAHSAEAPVAVTWEHIDRWQRIELKDCPAQTKITISMSNNIKGPWRSFCYWGRV